MKTIGIGVDIVKTVRIKSSLKKKRFINKTFGKKEIFASKKLSNRTSYYSKRFAAKEALAKALGTGFRNNLNFQDIQIVNDKLGKPYYLINTKTKNLIKKKRKSEILNYFSQFLMKKIIL